MDIKITLFKTVTNVDDLKHPALVPVSSVLKGIQNGRWKELVEQIRSIPKKEERDKVKKKLPAACFAGEFTYRSIDGYVKSSGLVPIDFDGLDGPQMEQIGDMLKNSEFVYSAFVSPSGKGWKALVRAEFNSYEEYKSVFYAIDDHFGQLQSFDLVNSDISRACFMSHDPDIHINEEAQIFNGCIDEYEDYATKRRRSSPDLTFAYLQKWMEASGYKFEKGSRNNYLYILASAMCRYGIELFETQGFFIKKFSDMNSEEIKAATESAYRRNEFGIVRMTDIDPSEDSDYYKKLEVPDFSFDPASVLDDTEDSNMGVRQIAQGVQQFDTFGLPALDQYFVLKKNELYGFVAGSKTGKTQLIAYLALMAAEYSNWNFLALITENEISDYKATMVSFLCDKPIRRCGPVELDEALEFIDEHFTFLHNEMDHLQILDVYHYQLTRGADYQAIIIDPITNIKKSRKINGNGNEYFDALYAEYLRVARKYVSLWVVAHTVTSKEREKTPPYVQDAEFGVYLARRCHYGITFYRDAYDEEASNKVECHIRLNRTQLTKGGGITLNNNPINFYFNVKSNEFGYDVEVDHRKYRNPLKTKGVIIKDGLPSPDNRIEKQTNYYDTFEQEAAFGEREPEF